MEARQLNSLSFASESLNKLVSNIEKVLVGKSETVILVASTWAAGGHVLMEDVPGTGKTMLANALGKSVAVNFKRTQFTPDLLPSDIVGTNIFNRKTQDFEFRPGPLFSTIFLADEINRATPRTQSALLESMAEKQITSDGTTRKLDPLFFVIATANPVEQAGTFNLPEAQLDRFTLQLSLGYPSDEIEKQIVKSQNVSHPIHSLTPALTPEEFAAVQSAVSEIQIHDPVLDYVTKIVRATRSHKDILLGGSPRATLAIVKVAKALALYQGQTFVSPDHVQHLAKPVLAHRIILSPEARHAQKTSCKIIEEIVSATPVPIGQK